MKLPFFKNILPILFWLSFTSSGLCMEPEEIAADRITRAAHLSGFRLYTLEGLRDLHARPEKVKGTITFCEEKPQLPLEVVHVSIDCDEACINNPLLTYVTSTFLPTLMEKGFITSKDLEERAFRDEVTQQVKKSAPPIALALVKTFKNEFYNKIAIELELKRRQIGDYADLSGKLGATDQQLTKEQYDKFLANVSLWYKSAVQKCLNVPYGTGTPEEGPWWHIDPELLQRYPSLQAHIKFRAAQKAKGENL